MSYCPKCGNTGIKLDGSKCECQYNIKDVFTDVSCMEIPEQYRGIQFVKDLVPDLQNGAYRAFLDNLHTRLSNCDEKGINYVICSPPKSSKTIFAYATIRRHFRGGLEVYPLNDLYELKIPLLQAEESSPICKVPYLFVKFPPLLTQEVFQTASLLLDRRVRHSGTTIFLYDGSWESLRFADKYSNFTAFSGDGSYCTVKVSNWKGGERKDDN